MSNFYVAGSAAMTSDRDDWETPQALYDALDAIYGFTLDPCAMDANHKAPKWYTEAQDGLARSWEGERVFCNPPYGRNIGAWVKKCAEESRHAFVVSLIPARTDTAYFHDWIYGKADIEFIRGRLKFERGGQSMSPAPFPSMLVYFNGR